MKKKVPHKLNPSGTQISPKNFQAKYPRKTASPTRKGILSEHFELWVPPAPLSLKQNHNRTVKKYFTLLFKSNKQAGFLRNRSCVEKMNDLKKLVDQSSDLRMIFIDSLRQCPEKVLYLGLSKAEGYFCLTCAHYESFKGSLLSKTFVPMSDVR